MNSQAELGNLRLALEQGLCHARQGALPRRSVGLRQQEQQRQQQGRSHRVARTFLLWQTLACLNQEKSPRLRRLFATLTKRRARQMNPWLELDNTLHPLQMV